ncbi:MAG: hypothetical protein WB791_08125 [Waddliaceae bacterium]
MYNFSPYKGKKMIFFNSITNLIETDDGICGDKVLEPCRFVHSHLFGRKIWKLGNFEPNPLEKSAKKTVLAVCILFTVYLPCLVFGALKKRNQPISKNDVIVAYSYPDVASIILEYTGDREARENREKRLAINGELHKYLQENYVNLIRTNDLFPRGPEDPRHWLLDLPSIPEPLHEDAIFSRYICSITQEPIRHVVGDPDGRTLYEKRVILARLDHSNISPVTGNPLRRWELVSKMVIQATICVRLLFFEDKFHHFLKKNPNLGDELNRVVNQQALQLNMVI